MGVRGVKQLTRRLQRIGEQVPPEIMEQVVRGVGFAALQGVVYATPVDTGRLRAGWTVTHYQPSSFVPRKGSGSAEAVLSRGRSSIQAVRRYAKLFLTNNVEYAYVHELGLFVPKDPGPSSDPRPDRKGQILVRGGFSVQTGGGRRSLPVEGSGMLANGVRAARLWLAEGRTALAATRVRGD